MFARIRIQKLFTFSFALLALAACSKNKPDTSAAQTPVIREIQEFPNTSVTHFNKKPVNDAVVANVTIAKSELSRTYLYGTSLQTSSIIEDDIATAMLSLALGQVPARLAIVGNKLQILADQSTNFESDVNHPDRLIHEFRIVKQDAQTLTIRVEGGSPTLATTLLGNKADQPRTSWLRSTEFVKDHNLFMFETSIEAADGSIAAFMETLMPRDSLVPEDYKPLYDDEELEPASLRFRFLNAGKVFIPSPDDETVRVPTAVAQRFHLKGADDVIRWYVTANIPDKYLGDIKTAVEGWNRYSQKMWGKDFIKFMGKLPAGVKIGDPRYNIITWDTVQDAGAAYESQAADPTTGIQSHSLIYLPLAWVNIGKAYWSTGQFSEEQEEKVARVNKLLKARSFMGRRLPVNCLEDATKQVTLRSRTDEESFARELLKGVLFHEVGHALGLAHNFKGSLSFDPDSNDSFFSTSIMDYNDYDEETVAFDSVDSANGPLLEYDRQIISVLYNNGKDVKDTDPVVPACNDEEADSLIGGVDPLCVRYDIGKNPVQQVMRMFDLLEKNEAKNGRLVSLPNALGNLGASLSGIEDADTQDKVADAVMNLATQAKGLVNMYIGGTANSLGYKAAQVVRNLRIFVPGSLPESYNEAEMRALAMIAIDKIANMDQLPESSAQAVDALVKATEDWVRSTPAVANLPAGRDRDDAVAKLLAPVKKVKAAALNTILPKLRQRVLSQITYSTTAPLYLGKVGANGAEINVDFEDFSVKLLEKTLTTKAGDLNRPLSERLPVASALASFAPTEVGTQAIARARAALETEVRTAKDGVSRENARLLLKTITSSGN